MNPQAAPFLSPLLGSCGTDGGRFAAALRRGPDNPAREVFYGNSNFVGQGAGSGPYALGDAARRSMTHTIAQGHGASTQSFFGDMNVSVIDLPLADYDPRLCLQGGWQADPAGVSTFGGRLLVAPGHSGAELTFTPTQAWNRVTLHWPVAPVANTAVALKIDDQVVDVIDQTGAPAVLSKSYDAPLGARRITVQALGDGTAYLLGMAAYHTDNHPAVAYMGGGCGLGSAFLAYDAQPWSPLSVLRQLDPDRVHIYETINDCNAGVSPAQVQAHLEKIVAACPHADVVLYLGYPCAAPGVIDGLYDAYKRVLLNVVHDLGHGMVIDCRQVLGSSNHAAQLRGFRLDNDHPSAAGHDAIAALSLRLVP